MKRRILSNLWWLLPLLALMAFLLQDFIRILIITPLAYGWFRLKLYYRSIPEPISWAVVTSLIGMFALGSLAGGLRHRQAREKPLPPPKGQVETLADWVQHARKSNYFKWAIANRLGKLTLAHLRGDNPNGSRTFELNGRNWQPPEIVQNYLQAGLERPFIEYSQTKLSLRRKPTPFDGVSVPDVVDYLESQME